MDVVVSGLVWISLDDLTSNQVSNIKRQLTIYPRKTTDIVAKEDPKPIFLFDEDFINNKIGIPRDYYYRNKKSDNNEILDVTDGFPMRELSTKFKADGPFAEQEVAINMLLNEYDGKDWGGAFLQADPGCGKTVMGNETARRMGRRTLILVHKEFLMNQWITRIKQFMPDARVGIIKQSKCEYDRIEKTGEEPDFVVGMLQSLCKDGKYPEEMYSAFGMVMVDEAHRTGSYSWSSVIKKFKAKYRLSLTATPRRTDGAEDAFFYHVSPITYRMKAKMMQPHLRKIVSDSTLRPIARGNYRVSVDKLNSAQVINQLCADDFRTKNIVDDVIGAVKTGRKVMIVSKRLTHLKKMGEWLGRAFFGLDLPFVPKIDYYTGEWFTGEVWEKSTKTHKKGDPKLKKRTPAELVRAESANVILCTFQMMSEALDIPAADVLVMATPEGDIEQLVGRVQRWCFSDSADCDRLCPWRSGRCESKPEPIIVDVIDEKIGRLLRKYKRRETFYRRKGMI